MVIRFAAEQPERLERPRWIRGGVGITVLRIISTLLDVGEIEGSEADEGAVAGDLVDDEVGVALLQRAAEARDGGGEARDADVGLCQRRGRAGCVTDAEVGGGEPGRGSVEEDGHGF